MAPAEAIRDNFDTEITGTEDLLNRVQGTVISSANPEGLSFGITPGGAYGAGYFTDNDVVNGDTSLNFGTSITGGLGPDGFQAQANAHATHFTDLGDGHQLSMNGEVGLTTEFGAYAQAGVERSWQRPLDKDLLGNPIDDGTIGFQSWSIEAGAFGSSDGLTGAVTGEVTYGNQMLQGFGRAAIGYGENGYDQSAEVGASYSLKGLGNSLIDSYGAGAVGAAMVLNQTRVEAGVRAGETPIHSDASAGQGAFIGVTTKFAF